MVEVPTQRTGSATEPSLSVLRGLRDAIRLLYRREAASICDYVREQDARTVVAREIVGDESVRGLPPDPTQHATCTSFVVAHLAPGARAGDAPPGGPAFERQYLGQRTEAVTRTVLDDFVEQYRQVNGITQAASEVRRAKDTWDLPNWYNTPLHLSGVAAALRDLGGIAAAPQDVVSLGGNVAEVVAGWLQARGGFVPDVGQDDPQRRASSNPYLTYWCVRSLTDWAELAGASAPVDLALRAALEANLDFMARILVANQAGIGSVYDAPDLVCSVSVVALASRRLQQRDEYVAAVLPHAVDVLLDAYVHRDGSFAPNTPVLEARASRRVITASSEELNAVLVHALRDDLLPRHLVGLRPAIEHADRKSFGPRGWGESAAESPDRRSAFVTAGALSFLRGYRDALDSSIARLCARELGVTPYAWDQSVEDFAYPHGAGRVIEQRVIGPITGGRRNLAVTSLVLSGPRRVPKDRVARKIAQDLGWPIVAFDPASFVRHDEGGRAVSLESEIGRVLDLANELSDTVIFLDRFDDTVDAFAQPTLRWSLFGRLGNVCARRRVLVVIDSAQPARIGLSADRSGHFVNVVNVDPPNVAEREAVLGQLFDRYGAEGDVIDAFREAGVVQHTHGLTEGFLHELVRACVVLKRATGTIDAAAVDGERRTMVQRLDAEMAIPHDNA
jgi:hypothetical protein